MADYIEVNLNGKKVKVNRKSLEDYQADVNRERNVTNLPEVSVTASKPKKKVRKINLKDLKLDPYTDEAITARKKHDEEVNKNAWYNYGARNFKDTFGFNAKEAAYATPIVGDLMSINDIGNDLNNGDYLNAVISAGLFALPNVIEQPVKKLINKIKPSIKNFTSGVKNITKQYWEDLSRFNWTTNNNHDDILNIIEKSSIDDIQKNYDNVIKDIETNNNKRLSLEDIKDIVSANIYNYSRKNIEPGYKILHKFSENITDSPFLKDYPAYNFFAIKNNLNPKDKETLYKFINNQSHSIRGVYTKGDEDYIKFLTHANNASNPQRRGADQLKSRGLYTSNSTEVSDKFDKAINNPNTKGYTAKLFHDFQIDKSFPIEEQLKQLQDRILETSIIDDIRYFDIEDVYRKLEIDFDKLRMEHPEIHAFESPYFGYKVKQRAYVNSSDVPSKQVADIVDLTTTNNNGIRQNRFSANNNPTEELFISQYPAYNQHNIDRYAQLAYENQIPVLSRKGGQLKGIAWANYDKKVNETQNKYENLIKEANINKRNTIRAKKDIDNINRKILGISSIPIIPTAIFTALNYSKNNIKKENAKIEKEYKPKIEKINNKFINKEEFTKDDIKVLEECFGKMDIREYKQILNQLNSDKEIKSKQRKQKSLGGIY